MSSSEGRREPLTLQGWKEKAFLTRKGRPRRPGWLRRRECPNIEKVRRLIIAIGEPQNDEQRKWLLEFERCIDLTMHHLRKLEREIMRDKLKVIQGDKP